MASKKMDPARQVVSELLFCSFCPEDDPFAVASGFLLLRHVWLDHEEQFLAYFARR